MSLSLRSQDQLEELLSYGASLEISVDNRTVQQLCNLASYASSSGARLVILGASGLPHRDLCEIAAYGKGHVTLRD